MKGKTATPSAARVARRYAAWIPGEVRDNNWGTGLHEPLPEAEGEGSQVPPARDRDGQEIGPTD